MTLKVGTTLMETTERIKNCLCILLNYYNSTLKMKPYFWQVSQINRRARSRRAASRQRQRQKLDRQTKRQKFDRQIQDSKLD